ncbi:FAD-dependent monooxygenase [Saccharopolyspora sp. 6M]|uniref:FAD-dependent monooxygenase n=1 Tax=Saccharopolyspora sp. 6M TaxID=2877237 RepID=UPI001CD4E33F|nr:FAD-dependent monooxygenase [Saccharopolyspora sp. 6M]MCA1224688.1 FAD-dependent monooxygenase [Saccharopolyspora sp. 6M]
MTGADADVVVVGAGPVGLVLAAELALAGAAVLVLERRTEPDESMKAASINVPTAEALARRGLLPAARQVQREVRERAGAPVLGGARFTGHFAGVVLEPDLVDWTRPELAAHAAAADTWLVPQRELEGLLADHLARLGVPVRRGVEVTELDDAGEDVLLGTTAGPFRGRWVVGCDGGRSAVRRLAGIDFPGTDPELTGYLAVADIAEPELLGEGWTWSERGAYRCGPQPGRLITAEFDGGPADRTAPVELADVQAGLRRISGTEVTLTALRGPATRWTDNARQAATYRSGRVLVAGDAAHVHPPFGGQGLNLGVGDAMNLGWRLGAVVAGWAPDGLLDGYDAERRPLGARVLDWTRAQTGMLRGDPKSAALREIVTALLRTPDGATWAVERSSGVAQHVELPGEHPLLGRFAPDLPLADGTRLVDHGHDGGFLLLDRTPGREFARAAERWPGRVRAVPDGPGAPAGALVRPDGIVVWAADDAGAPGLPEALHRWAGDPE